MTESDSTFQKHLLDIAARIASAKSSDRIGLSALWQAFLYLAHTGNEEAVTSLNRQFGKKSWKGRFPESIGNTPVDPLPLDGEVKRLIGPLSPLAKKYDGRFTPDNFLAVLDETHMMERLGLAEQNGGKLPQEKPVNRKTISTYIPHPNLVS